MSAAAHNTTHGRHEQESLRSVAKVMAGGEKNRQRRFF